MVDLTGSIAVDRIDLPTAKAFCRRWHYSDIFPPHCLVNLAYYDDAGLAGVALWGWGTRLSITSIGKDVSGRTIRPVRRHRSTQWKRRRHPDLLGLTIL